MNTRKHRNQSRIANLPPAQRDAIARWLVTENRTYDQVQELCRKEFGLKLGRSALCEYFKKQSVAAIHPMPSPLAASDASKEIIIEATGPIRIKINPGAVITIQQTA